MRRKISSLIICTSLLMNGCASSLIGFGMSPESSCTHGLTQGYEILQQDYKQGLSDNIHWGNAVNLLSLARLQQNQKNYTGCAKSVNSALTELKGISTESTISDSAHDDATHGLIK